MHPADPVFDLLMVILAAAVGGAIFERLRLPAIVGFLVTGAVVGPAGLGLVQDPERVRILAEFGVAFLLFEIGLELPMDQLRREWRSALLAGGLQVLLTMGGAVLLCSGFGLRLQTGIVMGMLLSLSSTTLVMRVLAQRDEVDAPHGRLALGILLFQDLCVAPFLLAVPFLAGEVGGDPRSLALALGKALVALGAFYGGARFLLPWILERAVRLRSPDVFSVVAFLLAMGSAVVAERIGLSLAVGAFVAGLVVSASPYDRQLFAEVAPLRGVLLGIFFTAVGMLLEPRLALESWEGVLVFVTAAVVMKAVIVMFVVGAILRQGLGIAAKTGLALAQTGEFSFVVASAAVAMQLLDPLLQQIFIAGSILTLIATPFLIAAGPQVAQWVSGAAERVPGLSEAPDGDDAMSDHVVIIGFGLTGRTLARLLKASNVPYCILETNPQTVHEARRLGEPIVFGDATRPAILESLGLARARILTVAISDREATRRCISVARAISPDVHIVARVRYVHELDALVAEGASQVVAQEFESTIDLFSKVLRQVGIPGQAISLFADEMREEGYELLRGPAGAPLDPWLTELLEEVTTEWIQVPSEARDERSIGELGVRARTGASVVAVKRDGETASNPSPDFRIRAGDRLLVLASAEGLRGLVALLEEMKDPSQ